MSLELNWVLGQFFGMGFRITPFLCRCVKLTHVLWIDQEIRLRWARATRAACFRRKSAAEWVRSQMTCDGHGGGSGSLMASMRCFVCDSDEVVNVAVETDVTAEGIADRWPTNSSVWLSLLTWISYRNRWQSMPNKGYELICKLLSIE